MPVSKKDFLIAASQSQVVPKSELKKWAADGSVSDGVELANRFVQLGLLTEWQAKYLLTGRSQLIVGNYLLRQRLRRDELGDHFQAQHQQLNRMVEILFLAASLSQNDELSAKFVSRFGETAKLDHPHLAHVYDVDRQSARYYLVTEFVDGTPLSQWLDREPLAGGQLAGWLRQALTGIRYAHLNNVLIGNFQAADFMITPTSELKLQNIVVAGLKDEIGSESRDVTPIPGSAKADLLRVADIFQNALLKGPPNHTRQSSQASQTPQSQHSTLAETSALSQLKQGIELFIQQVKQVHDETNSPDSPIWQAMIDDLVETCGVIETGPIEAPTAGRPQVKEPTFEARGNRRRNSDGSAGIEPPYSDNLSRDGTSDRVSNFESRSFVDSIFQRPTLLLVSAFFGGLVITALGSWWWMPPGAAVVVENENRKESHQPISPTSPTSFRQSGSRPEADFQQSGAGAIVKQIADQWETTDQKSDQDPQLASSVEVADHDAQPASRTDPNPTDTDGNRQQTRGAAAETDTSQDTHSSLQSTEKSHAIAAAEFAETSDNNHSTESETTAANSMANSNISATDTEREAREQQPFQKLDAAVGLPATSDTTQVKLGDLYIPNRYLLGLELSIAEGMAPDRVNFTMERSPENNQTWVTYLVSGSAGRRTEIAELQRRDDELLFRWLPEASGNRQAGYLRNGLLRTFTPEHSHLMFLRLPVLIDSLVLEDGKLSAETTFDLDFLPDQKLLLIELLRPEIEEISVSPNLIDLEMNLPGRVLLKREDKTPYMWVNLGIELKQRAKLRADLVISDGLQAKPLKNFKELNQMMMVSKQQELVLTQQLQVAEATPAPYGQGEEKRRIVAELRKNANATQTAATKYAEYFGLVQKMIGVPYGVRIVARIEGREFEIAKTRPLQGVSESSEPGM